MHLLLLVLTAAPVSLDCSLVTDVEDPRRVFVRAPTSWARKTDLTADAKKKVVSFLYEQQNAQVKSFACTALVGKVEDLDGYLWLEVKPDGALQYRGPDFGKPLVKMVPYPPMEPTPPSPSQGSRGLSRGVSVREPKPLLEWLSRQTGQLMVPVLLATGPARFTGRGAKLGSIDVQCESLGARAKEFCSDALPCTLWLRGKWKGGAANVFLVEEVAEIVTGDEPLEMSSFTWLAE